MYDIHLDWNVAGTSIIIAVASIFLATYMYIGERQPQADALAEKFGKLHRWAYKRFYMDEVYQYITHRIIFAHISKPIAWFDRHVIDGFFNFLAWGTNASVSAFVVCRVVRYRVSAYVFLLGTLILLAIMAFA